MEAAEPQSRHHFRAQVISLSPTGSLNTRKNFRVGQQVYIISYTPKNHWYKAP
jgi:hypothetical protein